MSQIFGQNIPLTILKNSIEQDKLHHAMLFHGSAGIGKFESALNFTKSIHCLKHSTAYCGKCEHCRKINAFNFNDILVLANDDRMKIINFLITQYPESGDKKPRIYKEIISNISNILYRHKINFLPLLERSKVSFPEGKIANKKKLYEIIIPQTYKALNDFKSSKDIKVFTRDILDNLDLLQNCQDRSYIPKSSIIKLQSIIQQSPQSKRVVILQSIDLITADIASSLLKILEEPPQDNYFILIINNLELVSPAVLTPLRSRCIEIKFRDLSLKSCQNLFSKKYNYNLRPDTYSNDCEEIMQTATTREKTDSQILYKIMDSLFTKSITFSCIDLYEMCNKNNISVFKLIKEIQSFLNDISLHNAPHITNSDVFETGSRYSALLNNINITDFCHIKRIITRLDRMEQDFNRYSLNKETEYINLFTFLKTVL